MITQVRTLTDDALIVLVDVAADVDRRLRQSGRKGWSLWVDLTDDYIVEHARRGVRRGVLESHEEVTNEPHTP